MAFSVKTPLMVAMVGITLGLTGCGGSDDNTRSFSDSIGNGSTGTGNSGTGSNTPLTLTFDNISSDYYDSPDHTIHGIVRSSVSFTNGGITQNAREIWGKITGTNKYYYVVANGFFSKSLETPIEGVQGVYKNVTLTQPSSDMYEVGFDEVGENAQVLHTDLKIKVFDISGNYNFSDENKGIKFTDDSSQFKKLPTTLTFPTGSICYAETAGTNSKVSYNFDDTDMTSDTTLESYLANENAIASSVVYEKVGTNNEFTAVKFNAGDNDDRYAVLYNGHVYSNAQKVELQSSENQDPSQGAVFCEGLNTVATDYLQQQIIQAYQ